MKPKNQENTSSIDDLFADFDAEKAWAVELIKKQRQEGRQISEEELERIARAIYFSTFRAAATLRYDDVDYKGNTGCIEPMDQIFGDVESDDSYGLKKDGEYASMRLAKPAFHFAAKHIFRDEVYRTTPTEMSRELIWRKREPEPDILALFEEYEKRFEEHKVYLAANLRMALDAKQNP